MWINILALFFSAVAAIASILSAYTAKKESTANEKRWNHNLYLESPKINLVAEAYSAGPLNDKCGNYAVFSLLFNNTSKSDISITNILFKQNNCTLEFEHKQQALYHNHRVTINTQQLPFCIPAMNSCRGYFVILKNPEVNIALNELNAAPFKIKVYTSRDYAPEFEFDKISVKYDI